MVLDRNMKAEIYREEYERSSGETSFVADLVKDVLSLGTVLFESEEDTQEREEIRDRASRHATEDSIRRR